MPRFLALLLALSGLLLPEAGAQPSRRVALVVGNSTYEAAGTLANPANDATDVAAKLREIGFEVIEGRDLGKRELERKVGEFADALTGAAVGMLFYAGHGIQVDGRNYIVPVDAQLDVPVKLQLEAVPIDAILDIMEQQTATSLVFLDACRNNPFSRGVTTSRAARPLGGLAQFDASRGSFIAFSTSPGAVAMDGSGRNSPFAAALVAHLATPGLSINDLMIAVRRDVVEVTRGQQRPWEQGSLIERFEFVPAAGEAVADARAAKPAAEAPLQMSKLERSVGDTGAVEALLENYLAPNVKDMAGTVAKLYAPTVSIFGQSYDLATVAQIKAAFFAQYKSWTLALEPGTLAVTPRGEDRADAIFSMRYEYVPADTALQPIAGRARVTLGLVAGDQGWRIASESSEAAP